MTQDTHDKTQFSPKTNKGAFERTESGFRHWVTRDGTPGPSGQGGFKAEPGRYHLYVALACPWANRTLIFRTLKELTELITVDVVHPLMGAESWHFGDYPGSTEDTINGKARMKDVYLLADPEFDGVVTVPVLWDKQQKTIVSNESSEIIRMFNDAFNELTGNQDDYYPAHLREEIDVINERVYHTVNNGVYRAGFASTQAAYDEAFEQLFESLDFLESHLSQHDWLVGGVPTEADWRLFPTLIRFDAVYHGHFKCNRARIVDYPALWRYVRRLYAVPGVAATIDMQQIKYHYYASHTSLNPKGIVPKGPSISFDL